MSAAAKGDRHGCPYCRREMTINHCEKNRSCTWKTCHAGVGKHPRTVVLDTATGRYYPLTMPEEAETR